MFWLDKVCIDQNNIGDGLKVLPVNVMACKKMLVLCGPTYTQRLWCAWELFTLFSFSSFKQAVSRVHIVMLLTQKEKEKRENKRVAYAEVRVGGLGLGSKVTCKESL